MRERMVLHELDAFMRASTEEARVSGALHPPAYAPAKPVACAAEQTPRYTSDVYI